MKAAEATLARLVALRDAADLSPRAAGRIARLIERLDAPVRIAVFGLPGAGKTALVNALAGDSVLEPGPIPVLLRHAPQARLRLTGADGRTAEAVAVLPFTAPEGAVFAELSLPLPALSRFTLLIVAAGAAPRDMIAGLGWAAPRCDIAIWCTQRWTAMEGQLWDAAPESLKNHALLVMVGDDASHPDGTVCGFGADAPIASRIRPDGALAEPRALRDWLDRIIAAARMADLDAAAFLLGQHGVGQPAPAMAVGEGASQPPGLPVETARPGAGASRHATLSRLVWHLRQTGARLAAALPPDGLDDAAAGRVLTALHDSINAAVDLVEDEDGFVDDWPGLHDTLLEAQALLQLIKMEGRPRQAVEAAILLVQVRHELDDALAA